MCVRVCVREGIEKGTPAMCFMQWDMCVYEKEEKLEICKLLAGEP